MHLTLVFLGEVDEAHAAAAVDAMHEDLDAAPFWIAFGGLGVFPPHGRPSVLWLDVAAGVQEAIAVQHTIASRLARTGAAIESRPYHPHLTVARWKRSGAGDRRRAMD